ncbi:MAG: glycosyltransferase family 2 protein [Lachnospiraceae bacterium]|nr:glycosyltransferase family 2 protein [Lachnospiraceae bacterium]
MIAFFYESIRKLKKENKPYWKLFYKVNKVLVNVLFPIFQCWENDCGVDEKSRVIVSMTTYPARIGSVWMTVSSLLQQTMKPYKVILWIAEEQFADKKIPKRLERLKRRGLEIRFCEDLKPHKKYYGTMKAYPDYYVITADDDILYPEDHIERLWQGHEKYPDTIVCNWSHRIAFDGQKGFAPYDEWSDDTGAIPAYSTLAVGCNGVLYPPGSLPEEAFSKHRIMEYALNTDDLWLKCMEILNEKKTVNCNETVLIYFNLLSTKKSGLWKSNTGHRGNNDVIWNQLMKVYPEVYRRLLEEQADDLFLV